MIVHEAIVVRVQQVQYNSRLKRIGLKSRCVRRTEDDRHHGRKSRTDEGGPFEERPPQSSAVELAGGFRDGVALVARTGQFVLGRLPAAAMIVGFSIRSGIDIVNIVTTSEGTNKVKLSYAHGRLQGRNA